MLKSGLKGMKSTEGRKHKKTNPGKDSLASVKDGGPGAKRQSVRQAIAAYPSMRKTSGAH